METRMGWDEARELLLERAGALGLLEEGRPRAEVAFATRDAEDAVIARLLDAEVNAATPTDEECRRFYDGHPERFTVGDLVEASHILFAVTPGVPVAALRARAEEALQALRADPELFADLARELSNCPTGAEGGHIGQFGRGEMVPELDRAVFATAALGVLPALVATRHGFHIVRIERREVGRALPYERVRERIGAELADLAVARALRRYLRTLSRAGAG